MPGQYKLHEIKKAIRKQIGAYGSEWLETQPVYLGDYTGTVVSIASGMYYARQYNGKVIEVFNAANVQAKYDLHVVVGRKKSQPRRWQIIEERDVYLERSTAGGVGDHAHQHMLKGRDRLPSDIKQIIQYAVQVTDAANFIVAVNGRLSPSSIGHVKVATQLLDLSSYVITSGAKYVGIEMDTAGVLSLNEGDVFASPNTATNDDFPVPGADKQTLAFVLLYETQELLSDDDIVIVTPLAVSFPLLSGAGSALKVYLNQTFTF